MIWANNDSVLSFLKNNDSVFSCLKNNDSVFSLAENTDSVFFDFNYKSLKFKHSQTILIQFFSFLTNNDSY